MNAERVIGFLVVEEVRLPSYTSLKTAGEFIANMIESEIGALLINVGSNSNEKNGVAPIYNAGNFEYWPIQESNPGHRTPKFKDLGLNCPYPDLYAHYDPRFEPIQTYGDKTDVKAFKMLATSSENGSSKLLLFASSLRHKEDVGSKPSWIPTGIGYYIIGFFIIRALRFVSDDGLINWRGHEVNAHYLRPDHDKGNVKVLVEGSRESRLLTRAYPISVRMKSGLHPSAWLKANFRELRFGPIGGGPWLRRTFRSASPTSSILKDLVEWEKT